MANRLKYPLSAYDKYVCLDMSVGMWLVIAFLLRPYLIVIISLANRQDRMGVIDMFYADRSHLALGALAAIPAVLVFIAWNKRKPGASAFARALWHRGRALLAVSAVLNAVIGLLPLLEGRPGGMDYFGVVQLVLCGWILVYLHDSERVRDTFADFPEEARTSS
jgi:hypothetical protein